MLSEPFNANKNSNEFGFGWHDQDFFRCLSALNAEFETTLNILSPIDIAITNPPADRLYDVSIKGDDISTIQVKWPRSVRPGVMMHFAGGTHTAFPDIEALYSSR